MLSNEDTVVAARPDPYIGKVIDKYKLVERLGAGGMGLVYRAEQARMDRCVAVKLLPFTLVNDQVNVKRIEREAKAMGNLRHPNIATIFDFGFSEECQPYLVMELITGRSLGNLIQELGTLDPARVVRIMTQVADAMDYAHKHGIIHRDLKPDNIMLDNHHTDDFVKVLDFGIAKNVDHQAVNPSQSLTRPGTVVGSPLYMSPEQCVGQKMDGKTDIYSLGVIMYEVLTGIVPCKGATIYETICKKTTETPPPFPVQRPELKELEELTLACLATMQSERPESMQEVRDRLRAMSTATFEMPASITISTSAVHEASIIAEPLAPSAPLDESQTADDVLTSTAPIKMVEEVTVVDVTKLAAPAQTLTFGRKAGKFFFEQKQIVALGVFAIAALAGLFAILGQGGGMPSHGSRVPAATHAPAAVNVPAPSLGTPAMPVPHAAHESTAVKDPAPSPGRANVPTSQNASVFPGPAQAAITEPAGSPSVPRNASRSIPASRELNSSATMPPVAPPRRASGVVPNKTKSAETSGAPVRERRFSSRTPRSRAENIKQVRSSNGRKNKHVERVARPIKRFFKRLRDGSF